MVLKQISIVIPRPFKDLVDTYCADIGLPASVILRLLVLREMRLRRLRSRSNSTLIAVRGGAHTMTAYFRTKKEVDAFDAYAKTLGMSRRGAAYLLLKTEMEERWLDRILSL